jgi:hydrogenase nickel incorporation protein HypA/HybF
MDGRARSNEAGLPAEARMHELAITQSVVDTIAERTSGARVTIVRLDIGKLSGVVPDAVAFCFDLVANGTPLDGAKLEIFEPPGQAQCRTCSTEFELDSLILLCPCGSADVDVLGGRELAIRSVEVA